MYTHIFKYLLTGMYYNPKQQNETTETREGAETTKTNQRNLDYDETSKTRRPEQAKQPKRNNWFWWFRPVWSFRVSGFVLLFCVLLRVLLNNLGTDFCLLIYVHLTTEEII